LSIVSVAVAMAYLLLVLVGAVGALSLLVWLFRDRPSAAGTRGENARNANLAEGDAATTEIELSLPEDRAA
jgi:hypothetical protein